MYIDVLNDVLKIRKNILIKAYLVLQVFQMGNELLNFQNQLFLSPKGSDITHQQLIR